jgi:hypothetical protein
LSVLVFMPVAEICATSPRPLYGMADRGGPRYIDFVAVFQFPIFATETYSTI